MSPPRSTTAQPRSAFLSPKRNEFTQLGLQALEARDALDGYARYRFDNVAAAAQRNLVDFARELQQDNLHPRMPDMVKTSGWKRKLKSHGKAKQRLMTGPEAAERDADKREKLANQKALRALPFLRGDEAEEGVEEEAEEAEDDAEDEEPEVLEDHYLPPPSTAPAKLQAPATLSTPSAQFSRAGRKRAPTAKALEAENSAKRGRKFVGFAEPAGRS